MVISFQIGFEGWIGYDWIIRLKFFSGVSGFEPTTSRYEGKKMWQKGWDREETAAPPP